MAEKEKGVRLSVTNNSPGVRFFNDINGSPVALAKGETREVEVNEGTAEDLRNMSKGGGSFGVTVGGAEPKADKEEKQLTLGELQDLEKKNLEEAQKNQRDRPKLTRSADASSGEKKSRADLEAMTKAELAAYGEQVGVDLPASATKDDMVAEIMKGQRKS